MVRAVTLELAAVGAAQAAGLPTFCLSMGSTLSSPFLHLTLREGKSKYSWAFQTFFLISKVLIF